MVKIKTVWMVVPGIVLLGLSALASRTESSTEIHVDTDEEARNRTGVSALNTRAQPCRVNSRSGSCLALNGAETDWNGLYKPAGVMNGAPFYRRDATHFMAYNGKGNWGLVSRPEVINTPVARWAYCAPGGKTPPSVKWMRMAGII